MDLQVSYFDPSKMSRTSTVLLIGRRGSGKSTMAADIMSHQRNIREGMCISPTDAMTGFWRKHVPPLFIHHDYDESVTEAFLDHQDRKWRSYKRECKKRGITPEEGKIDPAFAIYDDVTYDKSFFRNTLTRRLFMNGRHYSTFVLVTCQYLMDIGPDLRGQIDYVFILKEPNRSARERLYLYFAGIFHCFAAFEEALRSCTEDREAMVLDMTKQSNNISECVFFYRATPDLKFKLGDEEFWRFGTENYKSDDSDDDDKQAKLKEMQTAGLTKKDKEKMEKFRVRKAYPENMVPYKPKVSSTYADAYRENTLPKL